MEEILKLIVSYVEKDNKMPEEIIAMIIDKIFEETNTYENHSNGEDFIHFIYEHLNNKYSFIIKENNKHNFNTAKISLLNNMINQKCQVNGIGETIGELISCGADKDVLIELSFDESDINYVINEMNKEEIEME